MEPVLSSFILQMVAIGCASLIAIIGAFSKCFQRSRCTKISSWCFSCDRELLNVDSDVYKETEDSSVSIPIQQRINLK